MSAPVSPPGLRRPDASMDLLNAILREPVDPDYAVVAARGTPPNRLRLAVALLLLGALFAVAALQTSRQAPAAATQRQELIARVQAAEQLQAGRRAQEQQLTDEIGRLRAARIGTNRSAQALSSQIATLEPVAGTAAVMGPGLVVEVDDAPAADQQNRDRVVDLDLQQLINGLWIAGAEAIAINGHRLTALTAIRSAGDAITVDYVSLTGPYRVEAIGDPRTLASRFTESPGGVWWNYLHGNLGMRYDLRTSSSLSLPGDPGLVLRFARRATS